MRTLQTGNGMEDRFAVGQYLLPVGALPETVSELEYIGVDAFLQLQSKIDFLRLYNQVRPDLKQKSVRDAAGAVPTELWPVLGVSCGMVINMDTAPKGVSKLANDSLVGHSDHYGDLIRGVSLASDVFPNANHSLSIEEASHILSLHKISCEVTTEKMANSVETRCPAQMGAEGQYRTKQEQVAPGVCNEQVLSAKAKVCSELGGNVEKAAEMIASHGVLCNRKVLHEVTDCNTDYLYWRPHAERNMVPLDPDRFSTNQDALVKIIGLAANMTCGNRFMQAVMKA